MSLSSYLLEEGMDELQAYIFLIITGQWNKELRRKPEWVVFVSGVASLGRLIVKYK